MFGLGSHFFTFTSKCSAPSNSFRHSPIEIEVPHVFGRFLRSAHLLIVEDDPPVQQRDHRFAEVNVQFDA